MNAELQKILRDPQTAAHFAEQGLDPFITTPRQMADFMQADFRRMAKAVRDAAIAPE